MSYNGIYQNVPGRFPAGDAQRGKEDMGDHALT